MEELEELFKQHIDFCNTVYPLSTETSCLHHAVEEVCEIWKETDMSNKCEEYADSFMCLIHGMNKAGINIIDFKAAFKFKLDKNKNRKWVVNADGSYSHVK